MNKRKIYKTRSKTHAISVRVSEQSFNTLERICEDRKQSKAEVIEVFIKENDPVIKRMLNEHIQSN